VRTLHIDLRRHLPHCHTRALAKQSQLAREISASTYSVWP
jgi:hypothetical protein